MPYRMTSSGRAFVNPWLTHRRVRFHFRAVFSRQGIVNAILVQSALLPYTSIVVSVVNLITRLAHCSGPSCGGSCRARSLCLRSLRDIRRLVGDIGFLQIHDFRTRRWCVTEFRDPLCVCTLVNLCSGRALQGETKNTQ